MEPDVADEDAVARAVGRQILLGTRESLTIAAKLQLPVAAVNAALHRLQARCGGCITLTRPYAGEARYSIGVESRPALDRVVRDPPQL